MFTTKNTGSTDGKTKGFGGLAAEIGRKLYGKKKKVIKTKPDAEDKMDNGADEAQENATGSMKKMPPKGIAVGNPKMVR